MHSHPFQYRFFLTGFLNQKVPFGFAREVLRTVKAEPVSGVDFKDNIIQSKVSDCEVPKTPLLSLGAMEPSSLIKIFSNWEIRSAIKRVITRIDASILLKTLFVSLFCDLNIDPFLLIVATGLAITIMVMGVINMAHG
jgi:hypothetical protein